jgi:phospholipid/cholesterol/gamma-HCH transport system substrate-binding protein
VAPDGRLIQVVLSVDVDPKAVSANGDNVTAKLAAVGITGSMFVELDRRPTSRPGPDRQYSFTPDHPVIRSEPSNINRLLGGLDEVFSRFKAMNVEGTLTRIDTALDALTSTVNEARIGELSREFQSVLKGVNAIVAAPQWTSLLSRADLAGRRLDTALELAGQDLEKVGAVVDRVDSLLAAVSPDLVGTAASLRRAAEKSETVMENTDGTVLAGKRTVHGLDADLRTAIRSLRAAVDNLNRLSETLSSDPSRLLFGSPPEPRKLPGDEN